MRHLAISISLLLITLGVYWRTTGFLPGPGFRPYEFVSYDDDDYVTENVHVQNGLSASGIRWAFTSFHAANYHPATWLSHMLDVSLHGNNPGGHHFTSILIHAINAVLVYLVLMRLTGAVWPSAVVAALFALHPLHVESVAWVAERKDVLSTFFMLLAMLAYERYARTRSMGCYAAVACLFAIGLLSKPMIITLPVILLLIDYWPLGRMNSRADMVRLVIEKLPLFALSIASAIITVLAQNAGGAVKSLDHVSISQRLANAAMSYVIYLSKTLVPVNLSVFYPQHTWPAWQVAAAAIILAGITALALWNLRRMPWLAVGWFWYLVILVPVIGVIQVGDQAMADRYTYVPLIGVFVMIVWTFANWMKSRVLCAVTASLVIASITVLAWRQIEHWKTSETLFRHAASVTRDNWLAYNHLATALEQQLRYPEALDFAGRALEIHPSSTTHFNYGNVLLKMGRLDDASRHYQQAISLAPDNPQMRVARNNWAIALAQVNRSSEAEALLRETIELYPDYADAHANLGTVLLLENRFDEAAAEYRAALKLDPRHEKARRGLQRLGLSPLPLPQ